MKILIAYYSRTGKTKKVAEKLKEILKADLDEIHDSKSRKGIIRYIFAGRDALMKRLTKISYKKNVFKYDLVLIGTPNWAGRIPPAVRSYLLENKPKLKKIALFCTMSASGGDKALEEVDCLIGKKSEKLILDHRELEDYKKIKEFARKLK